MTETVNIKGNVILRRANQPAGSPSFRFVVRWILTMADGEPSSGDRDVRLPRVRIDPATGKYESDRFRLRIFRVANGAKEYFDFRALDFVAGRNQDTEVVVSPLLDAVLRPKSRLRWIRDTNTTAIDDADTSEVMWCATPDTTRRPFDHGAGAPSHNLDSLIPNAAEPTKESLSVGDLLFAADDAAARGEQYHLLRQRLDQTIKDMSLSALASRAGGLEAATQREANALLARLQLRLADDHAHRLARRMLGLSSKDWFDPLHAIDAIKQQHRAASLRVEQANQAPDGDLDELLDLAVMARALAPQSREEGLGFIEKLADAVRQRVADRENLALSTVHGGRWFIYNYDQLASGRAFPCETDAVAGQAAAPELAGLGYHSPAIDEQRVRGWAAQGWRIGIEIEPVPLARRTPSHREEALIFESDPRGWTSNCAARIWTAEEDRDYVPCDAVCILAPQLGLLAPAKNGWTTLPLTPCAAELLLDGVQLSPNTPGDRQKPAGGDASSPSAPSYPTGDAAIQLVFGPEDPERARGFNVYAVWQNDHDNGAMPDLASLRPWLVNARYSFLSDIYHAAEIDQGKAPSSIYEKLIASPPDSPVVPRPSYSDADQLQRALAAPVGASDDEHPPRDEGDLPDLDIYQMSVGLAGRKTFHHDLRYGTLAPPAVKDATWQRFGDKLAEHRVRWDPRGLVAPGIRARELPDSVPWRRDIDRYRLFVTATDMFGQESEPALVDTHSAFMSQNGVAVGDGVYRPASRRPLLEPPAENPQAQPPRVRRIAFEPRQQDSELVVEFSSPLVNEVELGSGAPHFMAAGEVEAELLLLRKFIMAEDQGRAEPNRLSLALGAPPPFDFDPVWLEHLDIENKAGFQPFAAFLISAPDQPDRWRHAVALPPRDHGYEYKAAIRFRLKSSARRYWFPDEPARRFHHFVPPATPGGAWSTALSTTPEILTRGRIGVTGKISALSRTFAPAPPLAAAAVRLVPAVPIGAVPQVDRDAALLKLLSREVMGASGPELRSNWPPESDAFWKAWDGRIFKMTRAQAAMMETALRRVPIGDAYSAPWRPFVELLAFDVGEQLAPEEHQLRAGANERERRAPIVGLRGAVQLSWNYVSASEATDRVEASEFRIHIARVPAKVQHRSATRLGTIELTPGEIEFELQGLKSSDGGTSPQLPRFFVLVPRDGGRAFLARRLRTSGKISLCSIVPEDRPDWSAEKDQTRLFDVQDLEHIWSIPVGTLEGRRSYAFWFPVGGGYEETIHWWVEAASSAQVVSQSGVSFDAHFSSSITPPRVTGFKAEPVIDPGEAWFDPARAGFFPSQFLQGDTQRHLQSQPRLKLGWDTGIQPGDAGIALHKEARSIWGEDVRLQDKEADIIAAIQRIAALPPGEMIALADLDLIQPWLEGRFNWSGSGDQRDIFWPPLPAPPHADPRFLPARGLAYGGSKPGNGFLDYFHDTHLPVAGSDAAIEYDHEYRYSVASYVDLGEKLVGAARYLLSEATAFSDWRSPPLPSWTIETPQIGFADDSSLAAPQVRLRIELVDRRNLAKAVGAHLGFSIEAARLLDGRLVRGPGDEKHLVSVGRNLQLILAAPGDGGSTSGTILLERVGRLRPDRAADVSLHLTVGAYLTRGNDRVLLQERPSDITLSIPPMPPGVRGEKRCDAILKIIVG